MGDPGVAGRVERQRGVARGKRLHHLGHRILLPGDLESPGLEALLAEEPVDCDVLLAPHHGSRSSNSPGLAAWCTPEQVIISGSRRWDPAPVIETYRATAEEVFGARYILRLLKLPASSESSAWMPP